MAAEESARREFSPAWASIPDSSRRRGLSGSEECALVARIARGDRQALHCLVEANLGLVVTIARAFQGRGLLLDDLIGEGNLGLLRAAKDYDPRFGARFGSYASYWIKQTIRLALMKTTATIRLPVNMERLLIKWRTAERTLHHELSRLPDFEEIASKLGLSPIQESLVRQAQQAGRVKNEGHFSAEAANRLLVEVTDTHGDGETALEAEEDQQTLSQGMASLDERERAVLVFHYGLEGEVLTLREIGRRLGISPEWARIIEARAIAKLKRAKVSRDSGARTLNPAIGNPGLVALGPASLDSGPSSDHGAPGNSRSSTLVDPPHITVSGHGWLVVRVEESVPDRPVRSDAIDGGQR